jgi:membrane protein required for colicin V production
LVDDVTILDWILIAVVVFYFVRGLFRGFLLELFDLLALVAGYFAARLFTAKLAYLLSQSTPVNRGLAGILVAIALFLAAAIAVGLLGKLLRKISRAASLGWIDRSFGAILATLKSLLIILVLVLIFTFIPVSEVAKQYVALGPVSGIAWIAAGIVREKIKMVPVPPTRVLASYLRSYGLSEEVVLTIVDQPDLMRSILSKAPKDKKVPVLEIMQGEPGISMPGKLASAEDLSNGIVEVFENSDLNPDQKAEIFWTLVEKSSNQ